MHPESSYCGEKLLLYDQACLHVSNAGTELLKVFAQTLDCYECSFLELFKVNPGHTKNAILQTNSETILKFLNDFNFIETFKFGHHGHYNVTLNNTDISDIITYIPPKDAYAPLKIELWVLLIIITLESIGVCASYYISTFRWLFQSNFARRELINDLGRTSDGDISLLTSEPSRSPVQSTRSERVQSIDTFRGLCMALMVFVNYGGGKYWFFQHAPWNGLTFADVVFPGFAFVMGMSELLSITSLYRRTNSRKKVFLKVFLRSLVLVLLGVMFNSFDKPNILNLRLLGVLQRLGLAYFIVGVVELLCVKAHFSSWETDRYPSFREVVSCFGIVQWIIMLSLVALHTCILFLMKVPGCPQGYIGPGGLHWNGAVENCTGGASRYIDDLIFTPNHMYGGKVRLYQSKVAFDPEGLLGVLTTSFTVFLGACAVRLYCRSPKRLMLKWTVLAILCGLIAGMLCNWSTEGGVIPLNKKLWSLSFTLANGSIGFLTICILYFLIDYSKIWSGSPFKDVGKNAILIYIGHEVLKHTFPWDIAPVDMTDHSEILLLNTWSTVLWILIAVILAKNNIILAI